MSRTTLAALPFLLWGQRIWRKSMLNNASVFHHITKHPEEELSDFFCLSKFDGLFLSLRELFHHDMAF